MEDILDSVLEDYVTGYIDTCLVLWALQCKTKKSRGRPSPWLDLWNFLQSVKNFFIVAVFAYMYSFDGSCDASEWKLVAQKAQTVAAAVDLLDVLMVHRPVTMVHWLNRASNVQFSQYMVHNAKIHLLQGLVQSVFDCVAQAARAKVHSKAFFAGIHLGRILIGFACASQWLCLPEVIILQWIQCIGFFESLF